MPAANSAPGRPTRASRTARTTRASDVRTDLRQALTLVAAGRDGGDLHRGRKVDLRLRAVEPQAGADVVRVPVSFGQEPLVAPLAGPRRGWAENPPFEEAQDRGVVVQPVVHVSAPRVWRGEQRGHPETELPEVVGVITGGARVRHGRRPHVVEEAAPLVVHEDEHAPLPLWRPREGDVYGLHEALTQPDVAARVVVG